MTLGAVRIAARVGTARVVRRVRLANDWPRARGRVARAPAARAPLPLRPAGVPAPPAQASAAAAGSAPRPASLSSDACYSFATLMTEQR